MGVPYCRNHGLGFEQAATVFRDALAVSINDEDHSEDEERWITLGQAENGPLLVVVYTYQEISGTEAGRPDHLRPASHQT